ncbi:MAG: protein-tyrosine phosphatase [Cellvibrionaceae bacterium]|jgi:protein-tyrosine phosphatase
MIWTITGTIFAVLILALLVLRIMVSFGGRGVMTNDPLLFIQEPETIAQAVTLQNGGRRLSWKRPDSTKLFISTDPTDLNQQESHPLSGEYSYIHSALESSLRYFYTIQHKDGSLTQTAERIWPLPGILNLRDIGGYETDDGRITRWGVVYRTAHLGNATDETLAALTQHGISLVCDLRSKRELHENPDRVPNGAAYAHTPVYENDQLSAIFPKLLFDRASLGDQLGEGYIRMIDEKAAVFADVIGRFADPANLPVMFHCTAGKDRAGLTAALLLSLLGVPRKTVVADYSLSNLASDKMFNDFMEKSGSSIGRFGVPQDQLKPLFVADPQWLENALDHIDDHYGGIEAYLTSSGGLPAGKIESLRKHLLV